MVEPPGTAPGSGPVITRAFITIVRKDKANIRDYLPNEKVPTLIKAVRLASINCLETINAQFSNLKYK
jgi:hypothetical protein